MADEPKWLTLARKELGTVEIPGPKSNPTVMQYYYEVVGKKMQDLGALVCCLCWLHVDQGWGEI